MAYDYAYMEGYELQPTKSVVLNIFHKLRKQESNNQTFKIGPNDMPSIEKATHLGIVRTTSLKGNMIANVEENIKKARQKETSKANNFSPTCVADISVNILTGILPIEAQVHIRAFGLFNNIYNQPDDSVEKSLEKRQLIIENDESSSWFIAIKHMPRKCDLQEASWYLNNPVKKTVWTSTIKKTVYNHWNRSIVQLQPLYKGLNFLTTENLRTGNIHPLFKINSHSAIDTARLPVKLKLLTGSYILQSKRIRMCKDETDPKCLLCAKEEENIEHFILKCESLRIVRNAILQEITTLNRQWEFNLMNYQRTKNYNIFWT
ncbi:unnamed protein product [Mytilus coruscus]|uniref:Reverse transcriptase zinc-binding domain-containing protein n=1 Tax=Mytilus coruscus TaxID=42192 RepID=A0A6J8A3I8_MYTCO|nr:unnamed protein product [Mytilus coruscus]